MLTPAATKFMGSSLFRSDLLTGHELDAARGLQSAGPRGRRAPSNIPGAWVGPRFLRTEVRRTAGTSDAIENSRRVGRSEVPAD